jgi:hypothetical protein
MQTLPLLRLGFIVGLAVAIAGRWVNSWIGALAILAGVFLMLYRRKERGPHDAQGLTALHLN